MSRDRAEPFNSVVEGRQLVLAKSHFAGVRYDLKERGGLFGRLTDVSSGLFRSPLQTVRAEAADGSWQLEHVNKGSRWDVEARTVDEGIPVLALRPPPGLRGLNGPAKVELDDRELEFMRQQKPWYHVGRTAVPWELRDRGRPLVLFTPRLLKSAVHIDTLDAAGDEPALSLLVLTLGCALLLRAQETATA